MNYQMFRVEKESFKNSAAIEMIIPQVGSSKNVSPEIRIMVDSNTFTNWSGSIEMIQNIKEAAEKALAAYAEFEAAPAPVKWQ